MKAIKCKTVLFTLLLISIFSFGYIYYEIPFKYLSKEQQKNHLIMQNNNFCKREQFGNGNTKNKFSIQIKYNMIKDAQKTFSKTYLSASADDLPKNTITVLKNIWQCSHNLGMIIKFPIQEQIKIFHNHLTQEHQINLNYINTHSNLRTNDSEFKFFADFSSILLNNLPTDVTINRIEIHGFTTRDMCPCCFTHMGLFYDRLKEALQNCSTITEDSLFYNFIMQIKHLLPQDGTNIELAFYISSSIQLGLQEFEESIYPSYAGTEYKNSVDQITEIYPNFGNRQFTSLPNEGIFCTFIRDNNPNWSLQYFSQNDNAEILTVSRQFVVTRGQKNSLDIYPEEQGHTGNIKCFISPKEHSLDIKQSKDGYTIKCTQGKGTNEIKKQKVQLTTKATPSNISIFRNLIQPWITEQVFNFAIGKANSLNINEKGFESSDSNFNNFLNSPSLEP